MLFRGMPRRIAAALITPPVSRRMSMVYSRSISPSVPRAGFGDYYAAHDHSLEGYTPSK
jgi:hypothetical protein